MPCRRDALVFTEGLLQQRRKEAAIQAFAVLQVVERHHPQQIGVARGQGNAHHRPQQHAQHRAGALVGRRHQGAADFGVAQAFLAEVLIQARVAVLQIGMAAVPPRPMPAGEAHAQAAGQAVMLPIQDQQVPVVGIAAVQVHLLRAERRDLPVGAGPQGSHPGGDGLELGGRKKIGRKLILIKTSLIRKFCADMVEGKVLHSGCTGFSSLHPPSLPLG